jgi:hypothetical protein
MRRVIELSDEQHETLRRAAEERGETVDALLLRVVEALRNQQPTAQAYSTDEWFRHLGATDEQTAEAKRLASERRHAHP